MTAKKRARNNKKNKNGKAGAKVAAAELGTSHAPTGSRPLKREPLGDLESQVQRQTQTDGGSVSKENVIEEEDICVHGLLLQYSNEGLKETIRACDDVVSCDLDELTRVFSGKIPQSSSGAFGRGLVTTMINEKLNAISILTDDDGNFTVDTDKDVDMSDMGICFTIMAKHPDFLEAPIHCEWIISHFISEGTRCLLRGDVQAARGNAYFACCFEQLKNLMAKGRMLNAPKLTKMFNADEHTLCSYFRNRIPCSCLCQMYKEVKSVTKTDMCWNIKCKQPDRFKVDRSVMTCCRRCRQACYCSSECQKMDWSRHKSYCGWAKDVAGVFATPTMAELETNKVWKRSLEPFILRGNKGNQEE